MRRVAAGAGLLHPAAVLAVVVLVVNDHVLKHRAAELDSALAVWVVGKLSDFAGLLYFPLLLQALVELVLGTWIVSLRKPREDVLVAAAIATAVVFAAVNLHPGAADAYAACLAMVLPLQRVAHTRDPTDLVALPMVLVAIRISAVRFVAGPLRPSRLR